MLLCCYYDDITVSWAAPSTVEVHNNNRSTFIILILLFTKLK